MSLASQSVSLLGTSRKKPMADLTAVSTRREVISGPVNCYDENALENETSLNYESRAMCSAGRSLVDKVNFNHQEEKTSDDGRKATENALECWGEFSGSELMSMDRKKENAAWNKKFCKQLADDKSPEQHSCILYENAVDNDGDLNRMSEEDASGLTDSGNGRVDDNCRNAQEDVKTLCESAEKSSKSVSSAVSPQLRSNNFDWFPEGDRLTALEDDLNIDNFKKPKRKRIVDASKIRLFEAKREFFSKFKNTTPDRDSMKMYDLIYYNPASNPMKSLPEETVSSLPAKQVLAQLAKENKEHPVEVGEDDIQMSAPQVNVVSDGENVINSQNLGIGRTSSNKNRKEMANLAVAVDTCSPSTYNRYGKKKKQRPSAWSPKETIGFYKALQTVGTDFTLMQTLFPTHTRSDLKRKYKKEEKSNKALVMKALSNPAPYDLMKLQKELDFLGTEETPKGKGRKRMTKGLVGTEETPKEKGSKRKTRVRKNDLGFIEEDTGAVRNTNRQKRKPSEESVSKLPERNLGEHWGELDIFEASERKDEEEEMEEGGRKEKRERKKQFKKLFEKAHQDQLKFMAGTTSKSTVSGKHMQLVVSDSNSDSFSYLCHQVLGHQEQFAKNMVYDGQFPESGNLSINNVPSGSIVISSTESPDEPGLHICRVFMVQGHATGDKNNGSLEVDFSSLGQGEPVRVNMEDTVYT